MRQLALVSVLIGALLAVGCRVDTRPKIIIRHNSGQEPTLSEAPHLGTYRLYALPKTGTGAATRPARELLMTSVLRAGERLGFIRTADGRLAAIVEGGDSLALEDGRDYYWQMRAHPGQMNYWGETAGAVFVVALVGLAVVGGAAAVAWSESGWAN